MKNSIVLISGASAGIGYATALAFTEAGAKLILLARRKERLDFLATECSEKYGVEALVLPADIRDSAGLAEIFDTIPESWLEIDVLINNAGIALGLEKIHEGVIDNWEVMIDTNIKGLLYLSRLVLPGMVQRNRGTVINIASIAGREAYPGGMCHKACRQSNLESHDG
jgi:NADP-dependent 3-hydroxy acid dehydrogenase YdfG